MDSLSKIVHVENVVNTNQNIYFLSIIAEAKVFTTDFFGTLVQDSKLYENG